MFQLLRNDAEGIADVIRRDLLTPLVRMNLGDRAPVPFLALNVEPPEDATSRADRLTKYMKEGLTVPAKWLRDIESIPDPTDGEEVVGGKAPPKAIEQPPTTQVVD
jgi:phage gp29-like protein